MIISNGEIVLSPEMENYAPPCLLVRQELLRPTVEAARRINAIKTEADTNRQSDIVREGLFVLAVASIETMLADVLRYYLRHFPAKVKKKEFVIEKVDLIIPQIQILNAQIDQEIIHISYQNTEKILNFFADTLSLDKCVPQNILDQFIEIKETRNLLLHNNLEINNIYLEKAGSLARKSDNINKRLPIDTEYFNNSLSCLSDLCEWAENEVRQKYAPYTKVAAIKRLWQFLFKSPVMVFEDYWNIDEVGDKIVSYKGSAYEDKKLLSGTELLLLGIWRSHFHGPWTEITGLTTYSLDRRHQAKLLYFLSILGDFRLE